MLFSKEYEILLLVFKFSLLLYKIMLIILHFISNVI